MFWALVLEVVHGQEVDGPVAEVGDHLVFEDRVEVGCSLALECC